MTANRALPGSNQVARAHDAMGADYDRLDDLWYPWVFAQLHELIAFNLPSISQSAPAPKAFDAGCGTGFQSFLLARAGYAVTGVDLSPGLIDIANQKIPDYAKAPLLAPPLFHSRDEPWIKRHHARLADRLQTIRGTRPVIHPRFEVANLETIQLAPNSYDVITCCGSVLSLLDDYQGVLERLSAALRIGGLLFIEVEQRASLDLLWPIADRLLGGALEYDQSWREIMANLFAPFGRSLRVDYPFPLEGGGEVILPIRLFSLSDLDIAFARCGLNSVARIGIHQATNLLPSTVLHRSQSESPFGGVTRRAFSLLRPLDGALAPFWPFFRLGCGIAHALRRVGQ